MSSGEDPLDSVDIRANFRSVNQSVNRNFVDDPNSMPFAQAQQNSGMPQLNPNVFTGPVHQTMDPGRGMPQHLT